MKVVYIPVTIPLNTRTIVAVLMTSLLGVIIVFTEFSNDWYDVSLERDVVPSSTEDTLHLLEIKVGPWRTDSKLCGTHYLLNKTVCHERSLVWQECRYLEGVYTSQQGGVVVTRDNQLVVFKNFEGGLNFNWCHSWLFFFFSFLLIGVAAVCGLITFFMSFYREKCHGPWAIVSCVFLITGIIVFSAGSQDIMDHEINQLQAALEAGDHEVRSSANTGFSMVVAILVAIAWVCAAIMSLSLCCCSPKHEPQGPAPTVQVVTVADHPPGQKASDIPDRPPAAGGYGRTSGARMGRTEEGMHIDYGEGDAGGGEDGGGYDKIGGAGEEMRTQPPRNYNSDHVAQYQA